MRSIFDETVATYENPAAAKDFVAKERQHGDSRDPAYYELLHGMDLDGMRVLDIACGHGRDVLNFRKKGADAYGCDISQTLLDMADEDVKPFLKKYDFRSTESLPFGGYYDLVWCCAMLVHLPRIELADFLKRVWNDIKPGGRLAIITKHGSGQMVARNLGDSMPRVMVFYTVEEILAVLKELGAKVEVETPALTKTAYGEQVLGLRVKKMA
jgi:2-polyprenyl-3-methyl-5-hydroxy-6-metoxy-1,4-benzoquinol methylase